MAIPPIRFGIASFALLALIVVAVYWTGLHGGFFFDDLESVLLAQGVQLETISFGSVYQALTGGHAGPSGRPVAQLSFALNHYFSGFNPFIFKATNLAIHLICGSLVCNLSLQILATLRPTTKAHDIYIATGIVTALWLLHPIQLLPVLHVVQRMTSLSALFLLAALLLHARGRNRKSYSSVVLILLAWGVFWPLSFFSKETGALFPFFAVAWELIVRRTSHGYLDRFARVLVSVIGILILAGAVYFISPNSSWLWSGYKLRSFSLVERLLTEGRVLWFYLGLIVAPQMQAFGVYHDDIAISTSLLSPWTTVPALFGLAGLGWVAWRMRTRAPLVTFGIAWFFIGHGIESTLVPLEIAHEHRNYLPIFGVLLAGASALLDTLETKGAKKTLGITLATVALALFTFVTALRSHQFGDEVRRTQIEAQHHRTSARAQYEAGLSLAGLPDAALPSSPVHTFARNHYELAGQLDPDFKLNWLALIHLNCKASIPVQQAEVDELARRLRNAPFGPADRNVLFSLKEMAIAGSICLNRSEIDSLFAAAISNPIVSSSVQATLHSWHADYYWLHEHDINAAQGALWQSLTINPSNPSNRLKWAQLVHISGNREMALQLLLALREEDFSAEEKNTLNELLAAYNSAVH